MNEEIIIEKRDEVSFLILNRPDKRNALSFAMLRRLAQALEELARDQRTKALIIRGAGEKCFCSGFDLADASCEKGPGADGLDPHPLDRTLRAVEDFPCPVVAMLNGSAYGGGYELAACCDFRVAANDIEIAVPGARLGIVYPWQGLRRFVQLLGPAVAKQLIFTGRSFEGGDIARLGLADTLVARAELEAVTIKLAEEIAANPRDAIRGAKRSINLLLRAWKMSEQECSECDALTTESWRSLELHRARAAFLDKP